MSLPYSKRPESYTQNLDLQELRLLSSVCYRFVFEEQLGLVDEALAKHSGSCCPALLLEDVEFQQYLTPDNATELYWDARAKGLQHFQQACAKYIGTHISEVAKAAPTDALGPVLQQAALFMRQQVLAAQQPAKTSVLPSRTRYLSRLRECGL